MTQDTSIKQVSYVQDNIAIRKSPSYLVSFSDGKKTDTLFIATKFEEGINCAKLTGFYSNEAEEKIALSYEDIVKGTDKQKFVELLVPWHRIKDIRSLMFRQK